MLRIEASDAEKTVINVYSEINDWMDCLVTVKTEDAPVATGVLEKAWTSYWEDPEAEDQCYGDWLDWALQQAGIEHEMYYKPSDSDEDDD